MFLFFPRPLMTFPMQENVSGFVRKFIVKRVPGLPSTPKRVNAISSKVALMSTQAAAR